MGKLPHNCVDVKEDKIVPVSEKGKKFQINNISRYSIQVVEVDGCVIVNLDNQKACDYAMIIGALSEAFLIELKGSDIKRACSQLLLTIKYLKSQKYSEINDATFFGVIVSSKNQVPKLKQFPDYIKLKKLVQDVWIKNVQVVIER